jgi:hypothetical protein
MTSATTTFGTLHGRTPFFILVACALTLGFWRNFWHVADHARFAGFQRDTESFVIGRMIKSRQDGAFSAGGLTGVIGSAAISTDWVSGEMVEAQYAAYRRAGDASLFSPYLSQPGGQAQVLSGLDRLLPLAPDARYAVLRLLTSVLTAAALAWIALWFADDFGLGAATTVAVSMLASQWLTLFGPNLYWSTWGFFVPTIAVMRFLRRAPPGTLGGPVRLAAVVSAAVFAKCLVNGYEYVTTTLVMPLVPLAYAAVKLRTPWRAAAKSVLAAMVGSAVAGAASLVLLSFQIASVRGSVAAGWTHIAESLLKRTHADPSAFPPVYAESLNADTLPVVLRYVRGTFVDLGTLLPDAGSFVARYVYPVRYVHLIAAFAAATAVVVARLPASGRRRNVELALVAATWFSTLAPLSWFVVFKSHSYIHTHVNFVLWQMPFTLFGFALVHVAVVRAVRGRADNYEVRRHRRAGGPGLTSPGAL